jgi:hypothetical protein
MPMASPHHLWISLELRQAIKSLQARFGNDDWQDKFESVDDETRLKYRALVGVMYKILDRKGTAADFVTMREACVPTDWLVTFLEDWKVSVTQNGQGWETLVIFIQGVIDKLGNIYILLINATGEHHKWVQVACMSSLLHQLKTISSGSSL